MPRPQRTDHLSRHGRTPLIGLLVLLLTGCAAPHVVGVRDGVIEIKGPRKAFGPGHQTYTRDAQQIADQHCGQIGGDGAQYLGGDVRLFDGDYTKFSCVISSEKLLQIPIVRSRFDDVGSCIRQNVPVLDDLTSDANTVASGIAETCGRQIDTFLDAYLSEKKSSRAFNQAFKKQFKNDQPKKILPFVLSWRSLVRNGIGRKSPPSEKDLPSSLFQI